MRDIVRSTFIPFTDGFEGYERCMYTDSIGLVTTGRGNLIDPGRARAKTGDPTNGSTSALAQRLPWKVNGVRVPADIIEQAFWIVKDAWPAVQSDACNRLTQLRLDPADVDALTFSKLDEMWGQLLKYFPDAEQWPAYCQLGALSMSWAMGGAFERGYPKFDAAALAQDWATCAAECPMTKPPVPVRRNVANQKLFMRAAVGGDSDELVWPLS